jgi:predicted N-acetyltransferase YhbS
VAQLLIGIEAIPTETYVREVLPEAFAMWGGNRPFERYVEDFRSVAGSTYAKRRSFTVGIRERGQTVSSCKNYDRELRWAGKALRATGIGAVFTLPALRGRGYASLMLGALLDAERAAGRDVAFLYSDIHPAFYAKLGFLAAPSRTITVRSATLEGAPSGAEPMEAKDWPAVRRCFEALDSARRWSLRRTPLVWDWMRRSFEGPSHSGEQSIRLVVRRRRSIVAYALGRRVVRRDAFVFDDFAFDGDEGRGILGRVLRAAAGDLARVVGWLPPPIAREALPAGSVRARKDAILMFAPLSELGRAWWNANAEQIRGARADATWGADHV